MGDFGGWIDGRGGFPEAGLRGMSRALMGEGRCEREAYCVSGFGLLSHRDADGGSLPFFFESERGRCVLLMHGSPVGGAETIFHAYQQRGALLSEALQGSFSFALLDEANQILLLGQSPDAAYPLYYGQTDSFFLFSTNPKGLIGFTNGMRGDAEDAEDAIRMRLENF